MTFSSVDRYLSRFKRFPCQTIDAILISDPRFFNRYAQYILSSSKQDAPAQRT